MVVFIPLKTLIAKVRKGNFILGQQANSPIYYLKKMIFLWIDRAGSAERQEMERFGEMNAGSDVMPLPAFRTGGRDVTSGATPMAARGQPSGSPTLP